MPELEKVRREYEAKGVRFVALSLLTDEVRVAEAARRFGVDMPVAIADGEVLGPLRVNQVPSTVFIDARGIIVAAANGEQGHGFFVRRVKSLLAAP